MSDYLDTQAMLKRKGIEVRVTRTPNAIVLVCPEETVHGLSNHPKLNVMFWFLRDGSFDRMEIVGI